MSECDIAVVGGGAAGLMAAVWAARTAPGTRVVVLESARNPGAKILVSGGGRCNVTHERVDASAFAGSSRAAIAKVLRRFGVDETTAFFRERGVVLKREETGKLFPVTDRARTVLEALLGAAADAGVRVESGRRVETVAATPSGFEACGPWGVLAARRLVLATGGKSYPKTGSDGHGYELARSLGHTLTPRVFPALVPLLLPAGHPLTELSGVSAEARLTVRSGSGAALVAFTGSTLFTHFGLSGPSVLDVSRYFLDARLDDAGARLTASWLPELAREGLDAELAALGPRTPLALLRARLPERLARALVALAGVDPSVPGHRLRREERRALVSALLELDLPIAGDRGFAAAEVTAGGVPLSELRLESMESRVLTGLHLCGEICDVDGRIGGFNFQWAFASGYVAGLGAARGVSPSG